MIIEVIIYKSKQTTTSNNLTGYLKEKDTGGKKKAGWAVEMRW